MAGRQGTRNQKLLVISRTDQGTVRPVCALELALSLHLLLLDPAMKCARALVDWSLRLSVFLGTENVDTFRLECRCHT
jgi:hypothetical protein